MASAAAAAAATTTAEAAAEPSAAAAAAAAAAYPYKPPARAIFGQADLEAFHKSKVGLGGKGWRW